MTLLIVTHDQGIARLMQRQGGSARWCCGTQGMSFLTRLITPAVTQVVEDAIDSFRTMGKRSVLALLGIVIGVQWFYCGGY